LEVLTSITMWHESTEDQHVNSVFDTEFVNILLICYCTKFYLPVFNDEWSFFSGKFKSKYTFQL